MFNILNSLALRFVAPGKAARTKYNAFRELLHHDRICHKQLAELEELYYRNTKTDLQHIRRLHRDLADGVTAMVGCLNRMAPASYLTLRAYAKKIDYYGRIALTALAKPAVSAFVLPLDNSYADDLQTGGKGLHLSLLRHKLGLPVPDGFIVSTSAFQYILEENNLRPRINSLLSRVDIRSESSLSETSFQLMRLIEEAVVPYRLARDIHINLADLRDRTDAEFFAVRSSAVGEDSVISFAGQYESVLDVKTDRLLKAYKEVLAGKYSAKAIYYRINAGLLDEETPMAVLVLPMINAVLSGVVTSRDPSGPTGEGVAIHYTEGLGDKLVGGRCSPVTIVVEPERKKINSANGSDSVKTAGNLTGENAIQLASWARQIEHFFQSPQEIEWCLDRWGDLYLLQARPMHIQERITDEEQFDSIGLPVLIEGGETASRGAACGPVHIVTHEGELAGIADGSVLVTRVTPPSYVMALERVCAVVADRGSAADHFASVAREAGVPVLVKTADAVSKLQPGGIVTVCADLGSVFDGCIDSIIERFKPHPMERRNSPFRLAFEKASQFIFPLRLTNPADPSFIPENCRSLHDIIRFVHEKGVQIMFSKPVALFAKRSAATLLEVPIPLNIYVLDIEAGTGRSSRQNVQADNNELRSIPLRALLQGLTHPGITWRHNDHFDWKNFTDMTMGGGIISSSDPAFASYAVVSSDYLNLNLRFGYHFVILDSLCGAIDEENYIKLRFAGGGGRVSGKALRLVFISEILQRLGFSVHTAGDLLDAQLMQYNQKEIVQKIDVVGRLLAVTTLLDMVIKDEKMVGRMIDAFMNGRYDFSGGAA